MIDHYLKHTLELPLPLEAVFPFFTQAANLERITPPELCFRIVSPQPVRMQLGALVKYRLRLFGIPFSWVTRIAQWDPPLGFVDEQLRGPYALWVHTHKFEATPAGTRIDDSVRYRLPLSPFGEVVYPVVQAQLHRIFAYRQRAVREALLVVGAKPN